jgi:hypothetical protein
MRHLAVLLTSMICLSTAQAQLGSAVGAAMMPNPIGVALTVGRWIYDSATRQQVYYIEVAGNGATTTEARDNGFRLAVESALGSLISSETVVQNGRVQRDEIISYAAGFVDRFETVETRTGPDGITVTMRVWVKRSALADRLLNRSEKSGEVDGARATVQLQTLNQERATGDRLLQTVLNDFPRRAFDITMEPTDVNLQNRTAVLDMHFRLGWNQDYLRSLWTAVDATSQRKGRTVSTISVGSGGWFRGFGGQAQFDDGHKLNLVLDKMVGSRPAVLVTVRGAHRETLFASCYLYQELDHMPNYVVNENRFVRYGSNFAQIMGGYQLRGRIQIPVNPAVLSRATAVDMDVVARNSCPNQ